MKNLKKIVKLLMLLFVAAHVGCAQTEQTQALYNVNPEMFAQQMQDTLTVILDVRTPEEFAKGHLLHAININFYDDDFNKQIEKLDKSKTILVYCKAGGRSSEAAELLVKNKFNKVYNLTDGYDSWIENKMPMEK
ncbi:MAG: rhodanese-like domain-containing protein [Bacteroidetes bacterium]|nr:rhodanese-like domain-containing protein [Bacteroidota bacterium]